MPNTAPNKGSLFDGQKKRRQRREEEERAQSAIQRAAFEAEEAAKDETYEFLEEFLEGSDWRDQMEQINIERDELPSIVGLWSFADLNETEGTQSCRRLFKAPVIWDELGHGLWKMLKDTEPTRRASQVSATSQETTFSDCSTPVRSRGSSVSSTRSTRSIFSIRSLERSEQDEPIAPLPRRSSVAEVAHSIRKGLSSKVPMRRVTDPQSSQLSQTPIPEIPDRTDSPFAPSTPPPTKSRYQFPKFIPNTRSGYANTIRRRMSSIAIPQPPPQPSPQTSPHLRPQDA